MDPRVLQPGCRWARASVARFASSALCQRLFQSSNLLECRRVQLPMRAMTCRCLQSRSIGIAPQLTRVRMLSTSETEEVHAKGDADDPEPSTDSTPPDVGNTEIPEFEVEEHGAAVPAAWRDAAEWVDLEFERAGLDSGGGEGVLASPWGSEGLEHPDSNVLWPHQALTEHRSRPFSLPTNFAASSSSTEQEKASKQLQQNRDRLAALWRYSASHGISWDELDHAYVQFAQAGKHRYDVWSRPGDLGVMAVYEKEQAQLRANRFLKRFCKEGEPADKFPSRTRRLTARLYTRAKRKWLAPWRPGRLATHLQQLVASRMLRRETEERAFHLASMAPESAPAAKSSQQVTSTAEDKPRRKAKQRSRQ